MGRLQRLRQKVLDRAYFLSSHAEDEMRADHAERADVEHAILHGRISRRYTADPRGKRYRITGPTRDGRELHVICRLHETGELVVITVYAEEPR